MNRFGDLTLLNAKLNQTIQDGPFLDKKPCCSKSDVLITQQLLGYDTWYRENIEQRQQKLVENAAAVWP